VPDDAKGKARMDIQIDASLRDQRGDNDIDFWKHTDATRQFQQAKALWHSVATLHLSQLYSGIDLC
jgi:hypothetical protein